MAYDAAAAEEAVAEPMGQCAPNGEETEKEEINVLFFDFVEDGVKGRSVAGDDHDKDEGSRGENEQDRSDGDGGEDEGDFAEEGSAKDVGGNYSEEDTYVVEQL